VPNEFIIKEALDTKVLRYYGPEFLFVISVYRLSMPDDPYGL